MSDIQSILFSKKYFDSTKARIWLKKHHYKPIKRVHITKSYLRYRLKTPDQGNYITKRIEKGIKIIIKS